MNTNIKFMFVAMYTVYILTGSMQLVCIIRLREWSLAICRVWGIPVLKEPLRRNRSAVKNKTELWQRCSAEVCEHSPGELCSQAITVSYHGSLSPHCIYHWWDFEPIVL